jgi:outer membrane autotransporter protein
MSSFSKSRLLATSAIAGLSMLQLAPAGHAQDSFGIHNDQAEPLEITVGEDEEVVGDDIGVYADNGPVIIDNAGEIRGNGTTAGSIEARPSAGVVIAQPDSSVTNSGEITGAGGGVVTSYFFSEDEEGNNLPPAALATETVVANSGLIRGEAGPGVALIGGGSVTNSGTIQGFAGNSGNGAQAIGVVIAEFPEAVADDVTGIGSITNSETGLIEGQLFGALLSGGGTIDNDGIIRSTGVFNPQTPNVSPFGVILTANESQEGRTATVTNSGTIGGFLGLLANQSLETAVINNSGLISGNQAAIIGLNSGDLIINNEADGRIIGNANAVNSNMGSLTLDNAGLIQSNGQSGVNILTPGATITNDGRIFGGQFGITTNSFAPNPATPPQGLATGTSIVNNEDGEIIGANNDAIRLTGGGSVVNHGYIQGINDSANGTDGVSIFAFADQDMATYSASVVNTAEGEIDGRRFGVVLSSGGSIENAGSISANEAGAVIQNGLGEEEVTGSIVNSGSIRGLQGDGVVGFGRQSSFSVTNSGDIAGLDGNGIYASTIEDGAIVVDNAEGGTISGTLSGVRVDIGTLDLVNAGDIVGGSSGVLGVDGPIIVDNSGTIRGNGTVDTATQVDAGIAIGQANSIVTNSGTISGAGAGISTFAVFDPALNQNVTRTTGTSIANSGTITGDGNDGIRLFGGGTVSNSGTIGGLVNLAADGIQINRFGLQALDTFEAEIANEADGTITGVRYGIIALGGGGTVANAGEITGGIGGVLVQGGAAGEATAGSIVNSGSITGTQGIGIGLAGNLATASLENSGSISGVNGALLNAGASTVVNAEGASIGGTNAGVISQGGTLNLTNAGSITGTAGVGIFSAGQTTLVNAGTISGGNGAAVVLGAFDDTVTLRTGSVLNGALVGGDGTDSLILDGDILELTEAQQIGATTGFEDLTVGAGYWTTAGYVGEFANVTINAGGALQVNEIEYDEGLFSTPLFTPTIVNDGLLVVNFDQSDVVSGLGGLSITGTGGLQLIGEGVFTLDTDTLAYHGGTTVSNGGLVLTGTLLGNVTTEGDGFFQLGAGGTEGNFSGDIVNNGRFIFNRSDDYDFLGAFLGNGTLDKMGDGVLTFMGDYGFDGITNIFGGSVRIGGIIDPATDFNLGEGGSLDITGNDQTIGGLAGEEGSNVEIGENTLTVDQAGNSEFGGTISGEGSFVKEGDGTLNFTGNSDYSGPTSVNGGTLAVNGSIVSDVTVNDGGTLGGNGTVGSTTVTAGGTIAPGNSIGQLTVDGDLAFAAGSIYEVEVNAAGQADRLDATGAVTIASTASVAVLAEEGDYDPRTDYVILTGADGVTGTFGSVTTDLAFLDPLLRYSTNSVTLSLYRNDIDFADVALGFNQASAASAVQSLGADNVLFEAVLVQNAATAQTSFGDLSGEIHANSVSGLTDDSRHLRNALLGMQAPEESGAFVWGSAFGGWGKFDAQPGGRGLDTDHKGLVAGVGFGGNGFAAALSAGIGNSDFRTKGRNDHADVQSKYLAAHATYGAPEGGFRGAIGVTYAWHDVDTSRAVTVAPFAQTLSSKNDADTLQIFGEVGYDLTTGKAVVTPFARLAHVKTDGEAFAETGGNAALIVAAVEQKTTFLSLGARARFNAGEAGFQPYVSAAWNRAFDDRGAIMVSRFAAGGTPFGIIGSLIPKNSAEVEAGFDYSAGAFSIGAAYTGTLASDRNSHGVRVTARIAF